MNQSNDPGDGVRIAQGLKRRDPAAMAQLYDAYGPLVYSRVYQMVQNVGTAEDLVQEVFFTVWKRAHVFDETRGSLCTWLVAIARNRTIDYLRSRESRLEFRTASVDQVLLRDRLLGPELDAVRFDLVARLKLAVGRLNGNQRKVVELAFGEGLSHSEVALRLKRPLGTVKTQLRSAIQALRAEMAGCGAEA
jgi:RNA polymerase sigma-70 factor (ECF subfamily)